MSLSRKKRKADESFQTKEPRIVNVDKTSADKINRAETKVKILESDKEELKQEIEELESKLKNYKSMNRNLLREFERMKTVKQSDIGRITLKTLNEINNNCEQFIESKETQTDNEVRTANTETQLGEDEYNRSLVSEMSILCRKLSEENQQLKNNNSTLISSNNLLLTEEVKEEREHCLKSQNIELARKNFNITICNMGLKRELYEINKKLRIEKSS